MLVKVTNRKWYNRIDDTVILGALPFPRFIPELIDKENVGGVVSMNENYELQVISETIETWRKLKVEFLQLSTTDLFEAPCQEKLELGVKFIQKFEKMNKSVYVHCKAGRTRSATLVACYLMSKHRWTVDQAVSFLQEKRHHIILRNRQLCALNIYYVNNVSSK
ncbi:hypothetical protein O3M35_002072 [Rhynocoris fuscipes]|uniref:Phosphatidylglycerophosphatase and protein-tyrosine phosphatase 1 n=1 Tax=Rhynocoris fuscipes TaxID=488301 RepID=A0AAW1CWB6_9HEMI